MNSESVNINPISEIFKMSIYAKHIYFDESLPDDFAEYVKQQPEILKEQFLQKKFESAYAEYPQQCNWIVQLGRQLHTIIFLKKPLEKSSVYSTSKLLLSSQIPDA